MLALWLLSVAGTALAGDHLYVSSAADDGTVMVYDTDTGTLIDSITMADVNVLRRSDGGGVVYARHGDGAVSLVRTRDRHVTTSPDTFSRAYTTLAVSYDRSQIYGPQGTAVQVQDAAGQGNIFTQTISNNIPVQIAAQRQGPVYIIDKATTLHGWEPSHGGTLPLATLSTQLSYQVTELRSSPYDAWLVVLGGSSQSADGDVTVYNPFFSGTSTVLSTARISGNGNWVLSVAFDAIHTDRFYVGSSLGYTTATVGASGVTLGAQMEGDPYVYDLSHTDAGDLYVLYEDRIDRVRAGSTTTVVRLPAGTDPIRVLAVPEPRSVKTLFPVTPYWVGLNLAGDELGVSFPWTLTDADWSCEACDEDEVKGAWSSALEMLDGAEALTPEDVVNLLMKLSGEDEGLIRAFIDEQLIVLED